VRIIGAERARIDEEKRSRKPSGSKIPAALENL
jgi:hypothetical protein